MSRQVMNMGEALYAYLQASSLRPAPLLERLREETSKHPYSMMQIGADQGQFMGLLVELIRAQKIIEVGTFTGYSSLAMALSLPPHGRLITCDIDPEVTATAKRYWQEAGVADKIQLRLGPALESLDQLLREEQGGRFDLAFIDADKVNYLAYYERCLQLLRPGGLILVDNVLWSGRVLDDKDHSPDTEAIRVFNAKLVRDLRINLSMLPVGDGLTLALKR